MARPLTLGLLVVAIAVSGCQARGTPSPPTTNLLVTIEARGGRCVDGECWSVTTIDRERRLRIQGSGVDVVDQVDPSLLAALTTAVDTADFASITAVPITRDCPRAFDGQEVTYTFRPIGRAIVRFSSCEVQIPLDHPVFRALDAIILQSAP